MNSSHRKLRGLACGTFIMKEVDTVRLDQKLMVGATAGLFGTGIVYPLDILKTHLQTHSEASLSLLSNTKQATRTILTSGKGNVSNFYRGFGACMFGIAPEKAIKLAVNDYTRAKLEKANKGEGLSLGQEILAGSCAGVAQLVVTVPYEGMKIKLQMQGNVDPSLRRSAYDIVTQMGPRGLYTGFTATLWRDIPFCMLFFPLYANLKKLLNGSAEKEAFHVSLVAGMISGGVAGVAVTPADVLKTRIQQGLSNGKGFSKFALETLYRDGMVALYAGWHTRLLIISPLYGFVSLAFELQKQWLSKTQV